MAAGRECFVLGAEQNLTIIRNVRFLKALEIVEGLRSEKLLKALEIVEGSLGMVSNVEGLRN